MHRTPASREPDHRARWWAAAVVAAAGLALFHFAGNAGRGYIATDSLFVWWAHQWSDPASETEHGWLVLGVCGWLLWRNLRSRFAGSAVPGLPSSVATRSATVGPAIVALLGALLLHAAGFAAQQARLSIAALLLFAWGVLRLGGGRRWGAAAVFPLSFMVFAIPLGMLESLGFGLWLRLRVVDASFWIAQLADFDVLRRGTQLVAGDGGYNYDVAAPCSGIRSLTALVALATLAGYLNFRTIWRRAVTVLACLPLVYLGNVARIVAIIVAAEAGGARWGDLAHEVMGWGVFAIVLGGLLGVIALLTRFAPEAPAGDLAASVTSQNDPGATRTPAMGRAAWISMAAGVALLTVLELGWLRAWAQRPASATAGVRLAVDGTNPVELPSFVGTEWIGRRAEVTAIEREILPPDTGYSRKTYVAVADPRRQVLFSIVLSGRDRSSIHRPELCLVGQGWTIARRGRHAFQAAPAGPPLPATLLHVERDVPTRQGAVRVPQLTAYWFIGADAIEGTHGGMFLRDAWQRLTRGRVDRWAYVLMQTDAADGEAAALARMQAVLDGALPELLPRSPVAVAGPGE